MAEAAQERLTEQLQSELKKLDKDFMRAMQVEAFKCSAKCCEDKVSSTEVVQRCVAGCHKNSSEVEEKLKYEVNHIQDRLTRCAQHCEDEYKDSASTLDKKVAESKAEQCLIKCCDTHSKLIPNIFAKLRSSIS